MSGEVIAIGGTSHNIYYLLRHFWRTHLLQSVHLRTEQATLWNDPTPNQKKTSTEFWISHESCGIHQLEDKLWLCLLNLAVLRIVEADRPLRPQNLTFKKREAVTAS